MSKHIVDAIQRKDYQSAKQLIKQLMVQEPDNPWLDFYIAQLYEGEGKQQAANGLYRQVLKNSNNPKIISLARQGLERIETIKKHNFQAALAQAKSQPGSQELGVLILESIAPELKQQAAQDFATIMNIDAYSARLQLPSRSWRLYRTGGIGELRFYVSLLQKRGIPCFCMAISELKNLKVYNVYNFQSVTQNPTVFCKNEQGEKGTFSFDWSEINYQVESLLPLFESSLEIDAKRNLYRKTKTLDYAQLRDLHLPQKKSILRFCDQNYKFKDCAYFESQIVEKNTNRTNWNFLVSSLQKQLEGTNIKSEFNKFAEAAIDFQEMLKTIEPHIDLFRRQNTPWDAAFQLYSGLVFWKNSI